MGLNMRASGQKKANKMFKESGIRVSLWKKEKSRIQIQMTQGQLLMN